MGLFDNLHEMQKNATGAAFAALGALLSLPHATLSGLSSAIQGKGFDEASSIVMAKYAAIGQQIGRQQSDEIVRKLWEAHQKRS
jgi:hypothetical protein